ncbi:MAG: radical SAM family heme chaperone HemW, partial [Bacteroidota bacterium]
RELKSRQIFFKDNNEIIETIYFGGGTPTLLTSPEIKKILETIILNFKIADEPEITIEANPDDLSVSYLKELKNFGINRISLGVQSFFDEDLKRMGRRHNGNQARGSLSMIFDAGFENVAMDLIYGLPWSSNEVLLNNIEIMDEFPLKHFSAYHLTIEPDTVFGKHKRGKKMFELDENISEEQFWLVHDETEKMGFEHYEISNFCKPGYISRHNTAYWKGIPYLGAGPGAHSFDGKNRFWNESNLSKYIGAKLTDNHNGEILTKQDRFNEQLMLALRTRSGINISEMEEKYPELWEKIHSKILKWEEEGFVKCDGKRYFCTRKGWFIVDRIIEDLFVIM